MSGTVRTAVAVLAAGDKTRPCTAATKRCDFWAWGEGNLRPACCTSHLLQLTAFVHELLERRGIVHWLDYGTLLGAVREGELIPWDEDVDFGILRTDVAAVRELKPEIEAAGHRLDDSWYPHVLGIQLSRANTIHVDLFVWEERDGLLMHRADSTWDWPGMQDRVAFSPAHLEPTEEVLLAGDPYPAPSPPHEFLRLHRYGDGYLTPRRATLTTRLHFDIESSQATPLVEKLLAEVARREQLLLRAVRAGSLLTRMRLWEADSDVATLWTALPLEPGDDYLERELDPLPPSDRTETVVELARALAWLQQGIDEYERPHRGMGARRMGRRLNRLARAGRRKGATTLASLLA